MNLEFFLESKAVMTQSMLRSRVLLLLSSLDKSECRDIFFDVLRNAGVNSKSTLEEVRIDFSVCFIPSFLTQSA